MGESDANSSGRIGLADFIAELRAELDKARQRAAATETWKLVLKEAELEVAFTTSKEAGAKGGVRFWVYEAGVEGKVASEHVQKVTLRLVPSEGASFEVSRPGVKKPSD